MAATKAFAEILKWYGWQWEYNIADNPFGEGMRSRTYREIVFDREGDIIATVYTRKFRGGLWLAASAEVSPPPEGHSGQFRFRWEDGQIAEVCEMPNGCQSDAEWMKRVWSGRESMDWNRFMHELLGIFEDHDSGAAD